MIFQSELQKGSKKAVCPSCSNTTFVFYVNHSTGEKISPDVGRCDRMSKCGYHRTPKDFYFDYPHLSKTPTRKSKRRMPVAYSFASQNNVPATNGIAKPLTKLDYIDADILLQTLSNYENNAFISFLFNLFPEDSEAVKKAVKDYLIGTTRDRKTIFWQIDAMRKVRTGKIIAYDAQTGKRRKEMFPNWMHAELKKSGHLKSEFNLKQCFFGEHLLPSDRKKAIGIVEAEKTALLASICFPEIIWLACGAKQNLNAEKLQRFAGHQIILYPDADAFDVWTVATSRARGRGLNIRMSSFIETYATAEQRANGDDLADYLIRQQKEINRFNSCADNYNVRLENVLQDEKLRGDFDLIVDEQKAVMMVDGGLSEVEAERLAMRAENVRRIVMSL